MKPLRFKAHHFNLRRRHGEGGRWPLLPAVWLAATVFANAESVVDSKHNLSADGPGTVRATGETRVCIFCHTPHSATSEAPLWNRYSSGVSYIPYSSSTAKAAIDQPTGSSKLCLSCHDGTVALGMVRSRSSVIPFAGGVFNMPPGRSSLGTDLSDDHPISFRYDRALVAENTQLRDPANLTSDVRLDKNGELQCTSCHDPHDNRNGMFLVTDNFASALCLHCHDMTGWEGSVHGTSPAGWNGQGLDPWPHTDELTVEANACESCHSPHAAGAQERLLTYPGEEQNCFSCHNGNVASADIEAEFVKFSAHEVGRTVGVHDPTEDPVDPPRHVECADCHNPHAAVSGSVGPSGLAGALRGVTGINAAGTPVPSIQHEYELCFRCHADSVDRGKALVDRQFPETNTRLEFDTGNASYHPVAGVGRNLDVPSLLDPYQPSSLIACTDCHNNDTGPGAEGVGPDGPHGSAFRPILERRLDFVDGPENSRPAADLCYKCHSSASILGNASFPEHNRHIDHGIACSSCHDPHGVKQNTNLINFNPDVVSSFGGTIAFVDDGRLSGTCTLTCHGTEHDALSYPGSED